MKFTRSFLIIMCGIYFSGCTSETRYTAYKDPMKKGKSIFLSDAEVCQQMANENLRPREGSEAAGQRLIRKRSLFIDCMKTKSWILKP